MNKFMNYLSLSFIKKVAEYNLSSLGNVLKMVIGFDGIFDKVKREKKNINYIPSYSEVELTIEQKKELYGLLEV